ncbi:WD40-repeat-containing domain protein [Protomyces lactucae-debilis]|uniref:WD40-repeat-containing domain protein n=1 Tax=Protomyces lactucae-debilis TaxID=2754530 RepID=A0A1Y2FS80_PROLT|nr:WD40-repeat-containing domain protein [Protomyces lactucae-debilis]ORY86809.1 WD40-repeat-containing domain protein [Protomyces lactucae-debilis]
MSRSGQAALSPQQALQAPSSSKTPTSSAQKRRKKRDHSASPASRGSPDRFIAGASRQKYFYDSHSEHSTPSPAKSSVSDASPAQRFDKDLADALGLGADPGRVHSYAQKVSQTTALRETAVDQAAHLASPGKDSPSKTPLELKPFRVLDAPSLSEDFYSSVIAWSSGSQLAVGIHADVHLWSEKSSHKQISGLTMDGDHITVHAPVTSLAYSLNNKWIAIGRRDGTLHLHTKISDVKPATIMLDGDLGCLAFRPRLVAAHEEEHLLVGGCNGHVHHYVFSISTREAGVQYRLLGVARRGHREQVTGLAWSSDGEQYASGGNDNTCYLYDAQNLFTPKYCFRFAVKALAFCPWFRDLLAAGGGATDKTIRFFNTRTGQMISKFDAQAQVTSLHWSPEYKELAATFGYCAFALRTQPSASPSKIPACRRAAVYAYPSMKCILSMSLPLVEHRATFAVNSLVRLPGKVVDGKTQPPKVCGGEDLIITATDESIRFFKIWGKNRGQVYASLGLGGGKVVQDEDLGGELSGLDLR